MLNEKKWYVLRTNPRAEKKVAERLTSIGIENYLPIHKQLKKWHDRKKYVDDVLIKGYVFVYLEEKNRHDVFQVAGVSRYLYVHQKIAIISEEEINRIKFFCTLADVKINKKPEKGDKVEVICGHLIGLQGNITKTLNGHRLQIYIPALECFASITISISDVVIVSEKQVTG